MSRFSLQKRSGFGPISAVIVTFLVYCISQLFAGVVIGLYGQARGYSEAKISKLFDDSAGWQFAFTVLMELVSLGLLWIFLKRRSISLAKIGLGRHPKLSDLGFALPCFGIYFLAMVVILAVVDKIAPIIDLNQTQQIGFQSAAGGSLALVFISLVVLPPLVEEIMIRGFLYSGLKSKLPAITSALVASGIFAAAHLQLGNGAPPLWVAAMDMFVLSMILIRLRELTGSLWSGITVHFIKNSLAFLSIFIF